MSRRPRQRAILRAASSRELRYMPDIHAVALIAPDGSVRSVTKFSCLPDTVDPRGPKGK